MRNKRGQINLSFGMLFTIFLIIVFLAFAFYAIGKFINFQKELKYRQFQNDFQNDVTTLWKSTSGSNSVSYGLPKEVEGICFTDSEYENLLFKSKRIRTGLTIEHLDIEKILNDKESFCIPNLDGKISFIIKKSFGENLVTVSQE